jgi:hypothetical protein
VLATADQRLYLAKGFGRNRVVADGHAATERPALLSRGGAVRDQIFSIVSVDEVLDTVVELAIHIVRAEAFGVYLFDDKSGEYCAVVSEGIELAAMPRIRIGQGLLGRAVVSTEATCWDARTDESDISTPVACVPFRVPGQPAGAIVVYRRFEGGPGVMPLDPDLLNMLARQIPAAIVASRLRFHAARTDNTIQGFLDLLTK